MSMMVGRGADVPETVNLQKTSAGDKCGRHALEVKSSQVKSSQVKSSPGISHERRRRYLRSLRGPTTLWTSRALLKTSTESSRRTGQHAGQVVYHVQRSLAALSSLAWTPCSARRATQCPWQAPPPFRISWPRWRGAGDRRTIQPRGSAISPARGARRCLRRG